MPNAFIVSGESLVKKRLEHVSLLLIKTVAFGVKERILEPLYLIILDSSANLFDPVSLGSVVAELQLSEDAMNDFGNDIGYKLFAFVQEKAKE